MKGLSNEPLSNQVKSLTVFTEGNGKTNLGSQMVGANKSNDDVLIDMRWERGSRSDFDII